MANALEKSSRTAVATQGAVDPWAAAAGGMAGSSAIYMKFNGNSGEFSIGQEAEEVPHGTKLAVNMMEFKRGWICWKDSEVVEEIMIPASASKPVPEEHELTDHGPYVQNEEQNDGWSKQASVVLRNLTTGEEYTFKSSSKSAYRSLGTLLKEFSKQYKFHIDPDTKQPMVPIVDIGANQFEVKNKKWGKKYAPVLKIVEWSKESDLVTKLAGESEDDYEQTPETTQAALPPPAATAAATPAAPQQEAPPPAATKAEAPADTAEKPRPAQSGPRRRSF